jgi:general secretion pathway protein K
MRGPARIPPANNRGVALLLAVTVISLLMAVTLQFSKDMRQELISSANLLESSRLGVMVKSGYNIAVAVLQQDSEENTFDSFHDDWAVMEASDLSRLYGSGKLEITIRDLSGRLQLNSLAGSGSQAVKIARESRVILERLLLSGDLVELSKEEADLIINAITDWIDKDDEEKGLEETESSYYLSREPSYSSKNGPMEFIEELLLIRGVTSELFYGTEEFEGLNDLVTVHGDDGKININTAPAAILKALSSDLDDEMVEKMVSFRQDIENKDSLEQKDWYKNVPGMVVVNFDGDMITTSSSYFRVLSRAEHNTMEKTLEAVVHRRKGKEIAMMSRKVK